MALSRKDSETDRLARDIAAPTGEGLTQAVRTAVSCERPESERRRRGVGPDLAARLTRLGRECAALPVSDTREPDEIIGYDENGLWT